MRRKRRRAAAAISLVEHPRKEKTVKK